MAKGEYEFYTLVVSLLVLALQVHNPFLERRQCQCNCVGSGKVAGASASPATPSRPVEQPPVYRKPQSIQNADNVGMSTDELLRELDSIQVKAKEQQKTLASAGRMPPPSPILQAIKEAEAANPSQRPPPVAQQPPSLLQQAQPAQVPPALPQGIPAARPQQFPPAGDAQQQGVVLRRREEFGRLLQARQPGGLGIVLGVGRGDFALRLIPEWTTAQGIFLVDPFIHIWRGYDDPANLQDNEHQMVFENLRNQLAPFEGRYVMVRDFSHSFAETYKKNGPGIPPTFCYIDANHGEEAISRDIELWWQLLVPGGILAGSTYTDADGGRIRVRSVVDGFASKHGLQAQFTHDDSPPSWFLFKP